MAFKRIIFLLSLIGVFGFSTPFDWLFTQSNTEPFGTSNWINRQIQILESETGNIDSKVLRLSLQAYLKARREGRDRKQLLTVIDFSKPSTEKRMWVFDLRNSRTLYNTWVSHGKNSGFIRANSFSNNPGSLKSSIGVFVTANPYIGGNGYSLRLNGLEHGFNDNALRRDIVVHGARYVNADTIRRYGQIGRSWGCPAVSDSLAKPLINTIKDNTILVAYYPDRNWLSHSHYVA